MDRVVGIEHLADEIDRVAEERGIDRDAAAIVVVMRHGDLVGDMLFIGPMSDENKRRRRRSPREVMRELGELDDKPQELDKAAATLPEEPGHRVTR
jgi:hypothetical protein